MDQKRQTGGESRCLSLIFSRKFLLFLKEKRKNFLPIPSFCTIMDIQVVESGAKW